jgi:hypothetical protein
MDAGFLDILDCYAMLARLARLFSGKHTVSSEVSNKWLFNIAVVDRDD